MQLDALIQHLQEYLKSHTPPYLYNAGFSKANPRVLYSGPYWDEKEILSAITSLLTGDWLVAGEQVHQFETAFAKRFQVKHCHMVNSGSSANLVLIAALKKRFNWADGDEIIVSPVGFPTTIAPIVQNNLKPVFVDIEYETLNFDVSRIPALITPRTRAIFVSPVLGNPPDMDELLAICQSRKLLLVGDNCDSLGSRWNGRELFSYYHASSCSFYPAHHITTGEGGMICSDDQALIRLCVSLSWWGRDCHCVGAGNIHPEGRCRNRFAKWLPLYDGKIDHKYFFTNMGYNLKPLDLQGAIGLAQLEKFDLIHERRNHSKTMMDELFSRYIKGVRPVRAKEPAEPCWFGTPFICDDKSVKDKLVEFLEKNHIQTRNYFAGNILLHPAFEHLADYRQFPNANAVLDQVFFVGASPHYNQAVFDYIEELLKSKWTNPP